MLRNYFITALRNMIRNRLGTLIEVISLATGITAFLMIGLYVQHELSIDSFHDKADRIYRLELGDQVGMWTAPGTMIKQEIPEVENVVRLVNWGGKDQLYLSRWYPEDDSTGERILEMQDWFFCDSSIFEIFTFDFLQGDPKTALRDPKSMVICESAARSWFGDEDPVGKKSPFNTTITGVFKDFKHSHLEMAFLRPLHSFDSISGYSRGEPDYLNNWHPDPSYMTYLLLPEGRDPSYVASRINDYFVEQYGQWEGFEEWFRGYSLRPLRDIYFSPVLNHEKNYCRHGDRKLVRILITVALSILILGMINYVNLSTARASLRAREVGLRKVNGSSRSSLIIQFLVESVLMALLAFLIALTMTQVLLPAFSQLALTELSLPLRPGKGTWVIFLAAVGMVGIIAGIYPAFYLTRFQPVASQKGISQSGPWARLFRRILLTIQYVASVILIICVITLFWQLHYMKSTDPGFNKELVANVIVGRVSHDLSKKELFREKLLNHPGISGVAFSGGTMGGEQSLRDNVEIDAVRKTIAPQLIDPDYLEVLEIGLLEGRNLSRARPGDYVPSEHTLSTTRINQILVNQSFVNTFGLEDPIGTPVTWGQWTMEIVGVVKDFHFKSLHDMIEPTFYYWTLWASTANIRISSFNISSTLEVIRKEYESVYNEIPTITFLDETYNRQYFKDEQTAKIIINFALVSILIACLGLFGLSSFMAARRIREIGIRKAFGASVQSVFLLLAREFIKWVGLSIVIACPVAWIIMDRWLENFAYRTRISWWIFALAILIAVLITFATITWQSLKTARTNPVDSLRYE